MNLPGNPTLPPGVTLADVSGSRQRGNYRVSIRCTLDIFADDAGDACERAEQMLPPDTDNITSEAEFTD